MDSRLDQTRSQKVRFRTIPKGNRSDRASTSSLVKSPESASPVTNVVGLGWIGQFVIWKDDTDSIFPWSKRSTYVSNRTFGPVKSGVKAYDPETGLEYLRSIIILILDQRCLFPRHQDRTSLQPRVSRAPCSPNLPLL